VFLYGAAKLIAAKPQSCAWWRPGIAPDWSTTGIVGSIILLMAVL